MHRLIDHFEDRSEQVLTRKVNGGLLFQCRGDRRLLGAVDHFERPISEENGRSSWNPSLFYKCYPQKGHKPLPSSFFMLKGLRNLAIRELLLWVKRKCHTMHKIISNLNLDVDFQDNVLEVDILMCPNRITYFIEIRNLVQSRGCDLPIFSETSDFETLTTSFFTNTIPNCLIKNPPFFQPNCFDLSKLLKTIISIIVPLFGILRSVGLKKYAWWRRKGTDFTENLVIK